MRNKLLMVSMLISVAMAVPAFAEEVIHFTNGTVLPIRSHVYEGDQVKIDLGDNGFMAFPRSIVAKIEAAPGVTLLPSTGSNKMFQSSSNPSKVLAMNPRQSPGNSWGMPMNEGSRSLAQRSPSGLPVRQMLPGETGAAAKSLKVIDVNAMKDTSSSAQRRAAGGTRMSLPNSQINQPKVRQPLTPKK